MGDSGGGAKILKLMEDDPLNPLNPEENIREEDIKYTEIVDIGESGPWIGQPPNTSVHSVWTSLTNEIQEQLKYATEQTRRWLSDLEVARKEGRTLYTHLAMPQVVAKILFHHKKAISFDGTLGKMSKPKLVNLGRYRVFLKKVKDDNALGKAFLGIPSTYYREKCPSWYVAAHEASIHERVYRAEVGGENMGYCDWTTVRPWAMDIANPESEEHTLRQDYRTGIMISKEPVLAQVFLGFQGYSVATLGDLVKRGSPVVSMFEHKEEWMSIAHGMGRAVGCLHKAGFVHCDLHWENIMVVWRTGSRLLREENMRVSLIDFGWAVGENNNFPNVITQKQQPYETKHRPREYGAKWIYRDFWMSIDIDNKHVDYHKNKSLNVVSLSRVFPLNKKGSENNTEDIANLRKFLVEMKAEYDKGYVGAGVPIPISEKDSGEAGGPSGLPPPVSTLPIFEIDD